MTRNTIGLLELALEISTAKANGCDSGDCSCGECELPLAADDDCLGMEQYPSPHADRIIDWFASWFEDPPRDECELLAADDECLAKGWEEFAPPPQPPQPEQPTQPQKPIL